MDLTHYPKQERIVAELRQEIAEGKHGNDGSPFMTTRYLMEYKNISLKTAHRILGQLCTDGLLIVRGKRYYLQQTGKLRQNRSKQRIGLLLTRLDTPYFSNLAANLEEICRSLGAELTIAISNYDKDLERSKLESFIRSGVSGIIACPWAGTDNGEVYKNLPVPCVLVGGTLPGLQNDAVLVDNIKAAKGTAEHLLQTGCREFFYICPENLKNDQRLAGFRSGLAEAGITLSPERIIPLKNENSSMKELIIFLECAARRKVKTGVFCYHDLFAANVIRHCHEAKIAIPDTCAVAGFDNLPVASAIWPPLTSTAYSIRGIAAAAAEILFDRIAGKTPDQPVRYLEPELIIRESTSI